MDLNNPVINLCVAGTRDGFEGRIEAARTFYEQAWAAARDDYEKCVAAHYVARRPDLEKLERYLAEAGWTLGLKPACPTARETPIPGRG